MTNGQRTRLIKDIHKCSQAFSIPLWYFLIHKFCGVETRFDTRAEIIYSKGTRGNGVVNAGKWRNFNSAEVCEIRLTAIFLSSWHHRNPEKNSPFWFHCPKYNLARSESSRPATLPFGIVLWSLKARQNSNLIATWVPVYSFIRTEKHVETAVEVLVRIPMCTL